MLTESGFEQKYYSHIMVLKSLESVSFSSALENLYFEYKKLDGDEKAFDKLLEACELK